MPSGLFEDPAAVLTGDARFLVSIDQAEPLNDLLSRAKPFSSKVLPAGLTEEDYAKAYLDPFGATLDQAAFWNEVTSTPIMISAEMVKDRGPMEDHEARAWNACGLGRRGNPRS